jgi:protein-disulfide isomerase
MPSGKRARQQRQQAAPPPVRSKGGPGGARQASPRTLGIAGGVIVLVIVAVVLGIVLTQSSSGGTGDGSADAAAIAGTTGTPAVGNASTSSLRKAAFVDANLKGIPQKGLTLGNPNAPVTLVEYIDLQCPICAEFVTTEVPTLVDKYVRQGKLKIEMKPWNILDAKWGSVDSLRGQKATIGASDQNKAFNFTDVLYWNQADEGSGWMNDGVISNIGASVTGLDTKQLVRDANSSATARTIRQIDAYANSRYNGTPTLLLAKGNAPPQFYTSGLPKLAALEAAIDARLK